jgi:hypothetical protein
MELAEATRIAVVCHEANRAYCYTLGDGSQRQWADAEGWQRESAIKGVYFRVENPTLGPADQHESWAREKIADGWTYGLVKDPEKKTHPCLVPYTKLPEDQKRKDMLFAAIVDALTPELV